MFEPTGQHTAEITVTNAAPAISFTTSIDHRHHAFGLLERPRFWMEQPYSPDDAWSIGVAPSGALAPELPGTTGAIDAELDAFFELVLDEPSRRLIYALPSGRYVLVRSPRTAEETKEILLGNELVPAMPNVRLLCDSPVIYAVLFGSDEQLAPFMSGLLVGLTVLSSTGHDTDDAVWFFDFHPVARTFIGYGELWVVLPLDGPLVIDAMDEFRGKDDRDAREVRERWLNERGPAFARWLEGDAWPRWNRPPRSNR